MAVVAQIKIHLLRCVSWMAERRGEQRRRRREEGGGRREDWPARLQLLFFLLLFSFLLDSYPFFFFHNPIPVFIASYFAQSLLFILSISPRSPAPLSACPREPLWYLRRSESRQEPQKNVDASSGFMAQTDGPFTWTHSILFFKYCTLIK